MNERIKELAEQAGVGFLFDPDAVVLTFKMEKFAELIVRECAEVCLDPNHWHEDAAGETYNIAIKEHFGVEE